ncbi:3933_t:CDS:2 [Acaulospora morrowiae]|uniref:3933_t:CDS:1 n=1 Tax=Acaulospora morrowiae TaxID=94023 RepID=A0A9N9FMM6_9GLOM|nr:3933_t:CDS:2 [Acaulospora morrowiae]
MSGKEDDTYAPVSESELEKPVLYFSEVSHSIDHGGEYSLMVLGTVANHYAIKANTSDGCQYLIERGKDVWKLNEFHHCEEGVTLGQLKQTAFGGKPYNLRTSNCQQATSQVANSHSFSSASNEQPLVFVHGRVDQE